MAWESKTVLLCAPSTGATATDFCPANSVLSTQVIYVPTHDPSMPTQDDMTVGVYAFTIVLLSYLAAAGLGLVIRLFKSER